MEMAGLELLAALSYNLTDDEFVAAVLVLGKAMEALDAAKEKAEALGPLPVLEDYTGDTPVGDWAHDYTEWWLAVWKLPKSIQDAITAEIPEHELSCGPPGHDYADHIVEYKGKTILDINLPEGEKGSPITGPGWTEVDPEKWSNEYQHKQRMDKAAQN